MGPKVRRTCVMLRLNAMRNSDNKRDCGYAHRELPDECRGACINRLHIIQINAANLYLLRVVSSSYWKAELSIYGPVKVFRSIGPGAAKSVFFTRGRYTPTP